MSLSQSMLQFSGYKVSIQLAQHALCRLVNLISEFAVAVNGLDIKSNVSTTRGIGDLGKTQCIYTTLLDPIMEGRLLILFNWLNFYRVEIACQELLVQIFQCDAVNSILRVDDIAQRL